LQENPESKKSFAHEPELFLLLKTDLIF